MDISEKQAELYMYLVRHVEQYGYQPSLTEVAEAFGVTAKAVRDRLMQLANKGYVELGPKYADRCIRLRHVFFKAQLMPGTPDAPAQTREPHPQSGPVLREAIAEFLNQQDNAPATASEIATGLDVPRNKVYAALQHDDGVFELINAPGATMRWRLRQGG
jgi:Mn-dependent DtxR family transcriptional regulator